MTKSYRIRTQPGTDKNIRINVNQDFDFLEILSLKLRQEDVYTRFCADYGVVAGRVIVNGGYGVPNANVSIFVPLESIDETDPVISTLYPYKTVDQKNEDGYRYNLLPYRQEYGGHTPTGTFPDREDVLTRSEVLEVYEKYYKFTVKTNESGDFMIIGAPLGIQTLVLDLDLSNIGCFSLRPADFIRSGLAGPEQFNGDQFKSSTDLGSLPQLVNIKNDIDVTSFWGETDLCNIGITRSDFDLRDFGIDIKPHAIFMGSIFSTSEEDFLKTNCKPKKNSGNLCDLVSASGTILAIRQTINYDVDGRPVLEQFSLPEGGKIIDDEGTWLTEVPMNLDYVTTNEFGEQILSNDPAVGIPTKAKYRFRIKYQNEDGMNNDIMRGDYLVPNIKEWGWSSGANDAPTDLNAQLYSYAFSLDWNEYGDASTTIGQQMIQEAVNCEDRFYEFNYNKVYTIANFVDRWKWGFNRSRHLGIKEITDRGCTTTTNRFPVNDGVKNFDFLFFLFNILITLLTPAFVTLIIVLHVLAFLYPIVRIIINIIIWIINVVIYGICLIIAAISVKKKKEDCKKSAIKPISKENPFKRIALPMLSYPDCEACPCQDLSLDEGDGGSFGSEASTTISSGNFSQLSDTNSISSFTTYDSVNAAASSNPENFNNGIRQIFAGYQYQNTGNGYDKIIKTPVAQWLTQGGIPFVGMDVQLSQSMNMANIRERYFDNQNIIQTTVRNTIPNTTTVDPSTTFTDSTLVLFCDTGTLSNLPAGSILSFYDVTLINDTNTTGLTAPNQFNSNNITGSTPYNATNLVQVPFKWINISGVEQTGTLKLKITQDGKEYKYKSGVEYFQVITGGTVSQFSGLTNTTGGLLNTYLFKKTQRFSYGTGSFGVTEVVTPITLFDGFETSEIIILNRGVDPYTEKQNIRYDLSRLFGFSLGSNTISVEGDYYLNVPIQKNTGLGAWFNNYKTPESQNVTNNTNLSLFHQPFGFTVDSTLFTAFTNNNAYYYNSTDKTQTNFVAFPGDSANLGYFTLPQGAYSPVTTAGNNKIGFQYTTSTNTLSPQGSVEGGTLIASNVATNVTVDPTLTSTVIRAFSPAYHNQLSTNITITNNNRLVLRSDRLPTSDKVQVSGNCSYSLHLNDNCLFYVIDEEGNGTAVPFVSQGITDTTNNAQDLTGDTSSAIVDAVLGTLQCENMTPLACYSGSGTNFGVDTPCSENPNGKRMTGGCYYFVDSPLLISIPKDLKYFIEWKTRFRMMFGACRGIFSHVFQNNWVNGSLYMFAFKKQTIFNITGQPKKYKFCGSYDSTLRPGQGPIFYTEGTTNSLFYRSTPYNGTDFIGQLPKKKNLPNGSLLPANYKGMNDRNLFFPTTVTDLGPRDEFTKEICANPSFNGYIIESIKSTSFNDTSDLLQLFILSRLINTSFLSQMLGLGDSSINRMFSRTEDRIDGDIAQLFSINSEYGVEPFGDDNYEDADLYVGGTGDALVGVFFSSSTENRVMVSPGITTFSPILTNYYGFPKTQEVPFYKWGLANTTTIFGSDTNEWDTNLQGNGFYKEKYQALSFYQAPYSPYFNDLNTGRRGFIFNSNPQGNDPTFTPGLPNKFLVGSPYHFYFGLGKGKSAINRYITKYILNQDV